MRQLLTAILRFLLRHALQFALFIVILGPAVISIIDSFTATS